MAIPTKSISELTQIGAFTTDMSVEILDPAAAVGSKNKRFTMSQLDARYGGGGVEYKTGTFTVSYSARGYIYKGAGHAANFPAKATGLNSLVWYKNAGVFGVDGDLVLTPNGSEKMYVNGAEVASYPLEPGAFVAVAVDGAATYLFII